MTRPHHLPALALLLCSALAQPLPDGIPDLRDAGERGAWSWFGITEPTTGTTVRVALTRSDPAPDGLEGTLVAQCFEGGFWAWQVLLGAPITDDLGRDLDLSIRVDDGATLVLPAQPAQGGSAALVTDERARRALLERVLSGNALDLTVRAVEGAASFRFALDGARPALTTLECLAPEPSR